MAKKEVTEGEVLETYYCPRTGVEEQFTPEIAASLVTEVVKKDGGWGVKEANKYVTEADFKKLQQTNPNLKFFKDTIVFAVDTSTGDVALS